MKKLLLFLPVFFLHTAMAQFYSPAGKQASYMDIPTPNIDEVFFFNGNLTSASISFSDAEVGVFTAWSKYTTSPNSSTNLIEGLGNDYVNNGATTTLNKVEHNTGYIISFNGKKKYFWVIDLKQTAPISILVISAEADSDDPCNFVHITATLNNPSLSYISSTGQNVNIPRKYSLSYNVAQWNDSDKTYSTVEEVNTDAHEFAYGNNIETTVLIPSPTINTAFTLSGDQLTTAFGETVSLSTPEYKTVAVEQHLMAEITEREGVNEKDRTGPATDKSINGSGPLMVHFTSNPSPAVEYYEWFVIRKDNRNDVNYYTDMDLRYTFKESGDYVVRLLVSNSSSCMAEDSITVTVSESDLQVPNVFTPNGDGMNDEFRVAYKSLQSYHCVVYSRWGRKVYEGSDPQRGWDGKIGGKYAEPGAYYYIIEAKGSDNKKYKEKGDINLIRGK